MEDYIKMLLITMIFAKYYGSQSTYRKLRPSAKTFNEQKLELLCFIVIATIAIAFFETLTFIISLF